MKAIAPLLLASLQTAAASPQVPPQRDHVLAVIERSYDPAIEARQKSSSWSLYGCTVDEYQIAGMDPVTRESRKVNLSYYRARGAKAGKNSVIILPPTGGVTILDRGYANSLCSAGVSAALVSGWDFQDETSLDFNMHNNGALRALAATRHVIEFLQMERSDAIGLLGTSIGAIAGGLAFGVEPRIQATALIVGSARFADVVAESDEAGAAALRDQRIRHMGLRNQDEYKELLRKALLFEPSDFLKSDKRKSLVVSADSDRTVPTAYQFELARVLGAQHLQLKGNHLQAILKAFHSHRGQITDFFLRSFQRQ